MRKDKLQEIEEKLKTTRDPILKEVLEMFLTMYTLLPGTSLNHPVQDKWLDVSETCRYLKISTRTLQNYRNKGMLPFSKIGAKIYFRLDNLNEFIESHMIDN